MDEQAKLLQSDYFCVLPWIHLHQWPDGDTFPCCMWDTNQPLGNYNSSDLKSLWNSSKMKSLRKNILNNKPTSGCQKCYEVEQTTEMTSVRQRMLSKFSHHQQKAFFTRTDGSVEELHLIYLDFRFSNLCNFKCNTCSATLSSAWFEDAKEMGEQFPKNKITVVNEPERLWNELRPVLCGIESITFAGGEPLIMPQNIQILDHWIENKHFNVEIKYITNFSRLGQKQDSLLNRWKSFDDVTIQASLDASGPRAEYLRKGTSWKEIETNRILLKKQCPNVKFEIISTVSAYNVWHLPDFWEEWIENDWLAPEDIYLNFVFTPKRLSTQVLPKEFCLQTIEKYQTSFERLQKYSKDKGLTTEHLRTQFDSIIDRLHLEFESSQYQEFFNYVKKLDEHRGENIFHCFPELKNIKTDKFVDTI